MQAKEINQHLNHNAQVIKLVKKQQQYYRVKKGKV
jgi:hypothetical protein